MENFAANFFHVKSSDAGAKGVQEFQSRGDVPGFKYWIRGQQGVEKVIIRDGPKPKTVDLKKEDQVFHATNPKITIEFINDECCDPNDKNVLFTSKVDLRISTNDNENNYFENWNCTACSTSNSRKIKSDLQSRIDKVSRCYQTREDGVTDCHKCSLVKAGQFCYPGNYTVEFKTENQCKNVTYGECDFGKKVVRTEPKPVLSARKCNELCMDYSECDFYHYNRQTKVCKMLDSQYRKDHCNIRAGPVDKAASACLVIDNAKICDAILEEECEYNGELLDTLGNGQITSADGCQDACKDRDSYCKYWEYNMKESVCLLRGSVQKKCNVEAGPSLEKNQYDLCLQKFANDAAN